MSEMSATPLHTRTHHSGYGPQNECFVIHPSSPLSVMLYRFLIALVFLFGSIKMVLYQSITNRQFWKNWKKREVSKWAIAPSHTQLPLYAQHVLTEYHPRKSSGSMCHLPMVIETYVFSWRYERANLREKKVVFLWTKVYVLGAAASFARSLHYNHNYLV